MAPSAVREIPSTAIVALAHKACTSCSHVKALEDFHFEKGTPDGHRSVCKVCCLERAAVRRATHGDHIRAQQREHYQRTRDEQCAYQRDYRRAHRAKLRAYFRTYRQRRPDVIRRGRDKWNAANPEKRYAHSVFWRALRRGTIARPDACGACGQRGYVEAHHADYRQPLLVQWLCELCHVKADVIRRRAA